MTPAYGAALDIGAAFGSVLQPYIEAAVQALILAVMGYLTVKLKNKWNIDIDAQQRDALTKFLQRQASSLVADGAVKLNGVKVEVSNPALARAADAALKTIPDAIKHFDVKPQQVADMIVDMIPKEPAVAQAQAVAIDVANPATPSLPPVQVVVQETQK